MIAGFFIIVILQNMAQQYPDSQPEYPEECQTLSDLGFDIIPFIGVTWLSESGSDLNSVADIWIVTSIVITVLLFLFVFPYPQLLFRRFLICYGSVFALRALTVMATVYPRLPFKSENFVSSNPLWGAFLILAGARTTARDMMFSGHTSGFILCASFVSHYTSSRLFAIIFWVYNVLGALSLIAVREHYTADVLVAVIISRLIFFLYHVVIEYVPVRAKKRYYMFRLWFYLDHSETERYKCSI